MEQQDLKILHEVTKLLSDWTAGMQEQIVAVHDVVKALRERIASGEEEEEEIGGETGE